MVYKYSDLPKLKEQVAANPALAAMLGDIISRLEAKDFDGTGDPLGNRQIEERPPSIEQKRPPSIEKEIEQVISGPSFPGRQTPKARDLPVRIPEPVGPITDTRTMPSMPVAPVPSPMSVPPIAIEDPDIQKVVDALPKGTQQPVQPPVIPPTITMPPIIETPPQTEVKLPDGTVIDLSDIMPQPEEERIPVDPTDPNDPMYGIFPGAEPKDLLPPMSLVDAEGNPFVLRHSEQDPITGEVLNNQPFGNVSGTVSLDEIAPPPEPPLTNAELKEKILSGELPMSMAPKPDMQPELPVGIDPIPDPTSSTETTPAPESTPVQGMTMEQMQQMIADMQAQQQEQAATRAAQEKEMTQNYMVPGSRMGYNPYLSGQYQSDPYGPSGVPNMGGITTIPVPDGYGIYNPIYGG